VLHLHKKQHARGGGVCRPRKVAFVSSLQVGARAVFASNGAAGIDTRQRATGLGRAQVAQRSGTERHASNPLGARCSSKAIVAAARGRALAASRMQSSYGHARRSRLRRGTRLEKSRRRKQCGSEARAGLNGPSVRERAFSDVSPRMRSLLRFVHGGSRISTDPGSKSRNGSSGDRHLARSVAPVPSLWCAPACAAQVRLRRWPVWRRSGRGWPPSFRAAGAPARTSSRAPRCRS
jgi:hypothetical protein